MVVNNVWHIKLGQDLDPRPCIKAEYHHHFCFLKQTTVASVYIPSTEVGEAGRWIPLARWSASVAELVSSGLVRDTFSKAR